MLPNRQSAVFGFMSALIILVGCRGDSTGLSARSTPIPIVTSLPTATNLPTPTSSPEIATPADSVIPEQPTPTVEMVASSTPLPTYTPGSSPTPTPSQAATLTASPTLNVAPTQTPAAADNPMPSPTAFHPRVEIPHAVPNPPIAMAPNMVSLHTVIDSSASDLAFSANGRCSISPTTST